MSDPNQPLCGCGRELRYTHSEDRMSCNMHVVCLNYDEQFDLIKELKNDSDRYRKALERIVQIRAMEYEYKSWAKEALKDLE